MDTAEKNAARYAAGASSILSGCFGLMHEPQTSMQMLVSLS